jgi:ankyrin repeat protein
MAPIEIAAREGHWEVVDEFLGHNPTIRPEGAEYLRSQLYEASESGETEVVRIILKCGISVNTNNKFGHTPLYVAAKSGQTEITGILLGSGANVNIPDNRGKIPLIVAAENGHVEIIRSLRTKALKEEDQYVIRSLNYGGIVDITDEDGSTPLYVAALNGHV